MLVVPGHGPAVGPAVKPGSATSVPEKVIQSPTSSGACRVESGNSPGNCGKAGFVRLFVVMLVK